MSRTHKIQKAYIAHHSDIVPFSNKDIFRETGWRYGNNRKTYAKTKVRDRKLERRKFKKFKIDEENG